MIKSPSLSAHIFQLESSDAVATMGFDGCSAIADTGAVWAVLVFERPQRDTCGMTSAE